MSCVGWLWRRLWNFGDLNEIIVLDQTRYAQTRDSSAPSLFSAFFPLWLGIELYLLRKNLWPSFLIWKTSCVPNTAPPHSREPPYPHNSCRIRSSLDTYSDSWVWCKPSPVDLHAKKTWLLSNNPVCEVRYLWFQVEGQKTGRSIWIDSWSSFFLLDLTTKFSQVLNTNLRL